MMHQSPFKVSHPNYNIALQLKTHPFSIKPKVKKITIIILCNFDLVSSPDPTLKEGKGSGDLGKKLGPVDDPRRNLRVPIRLQL